MVTADFGDSLRAGTTALRAGARRGEGGQRRQRPRRRRRLPPGARRARRSSGASATAPRPLLIGRQTWRAATRGAARDRGRDHRSLARRRATVRALVGGPLRRRARLPRQPGRGRARPARRRPARSPKDFAQGGAVRARRAQPRRRRQALGFDPKTQVQDPLFGQLGNAGAAFAPMLLAAALEKAQAGDTPAGRELRRRRRRARCCRSPTRIERARAIGAASRWHLAAPQRARRLRQVSALPQPRAARVDRRAGAGVSATVHFRDRDEDISLHGQRCRKCGQEQFPLPARLLHLLRARRLRDGAARRIARARCCRYTFDFFAGSPDPPLIVTMTEAEGGAALYLQMTDARRRR